MSLEEKVYLIEDFLLGFEENFFGDRKLLMLIDKYIAVCII